MNVNKNNIELFVFCWYFPQTVYPEFYFYFGLAFLVIRMRVRVKERCSSVIGQD